VYVRWTKSYASYKSAEVVRREGQEEKAEIGLARRRMTERRTAAQDYILDET